MRDKIRVVIEKEVDRVTKQERDRASRNSIYYVEKSYDPISFLC
jgi:hypothetical protein